jgi:hypothetical protein
MTTIKAVSKGYYHDKRTWGGTVPGRTDIADAGEFTVGISRSVSCRSLQTTGGGEFIVRSVPLWRRVLQILHLPGGAMTIRANIEGTTSLCHNRGVVRIVGDVATGKGGPTVWVEGCGTCVVDGNIGSDKEAAL